MVRCISFTTKKALQKAYPNNDKLNEPFNFCDYVIFIAIIYSLILIADLGRVLYIQTG